jgi:hypothetical protein
MPDLDRLTLPDRELAKFDIDKNGNIVIRVIGYMNNTLVKEDYDSIYPDFSGSLTDIWTYKKNTISVATVTITYSTSTKETISSIIKT